MISLWSLIHLGRLHNRRLSISRWSLIDRGRLHGLARNARKSWHRRSAQTLHDTAVDLGGLLLNPTKALPTGEEKARSGTLSRLSKRARTGVSDLK